MSNDTFTLDLFGNTSLSSGLGLGVTAFGGLVDDDRVTEDASNREGAAAPAPTSPNGDSSPSTLRPTPDAMPCGQNFFLEGNRGLAKGWKQRPRDNLDGSSSPRASSTSSA